MYRKGLLLLLVIVLATGALIGCTGPTETTTDEPKILRLARSSAGATGNHHTSSLGDDNTQIRYYVGTLYDNVPSPDRKTAGLQPVFASDLPEDVNGDGSVWRIPLREDNKWANGEPIDAETFMYSWKMLLDPQMLNPHATSFITGRVGVVNATEYYEQGTSQTVAWEDVGLKAIDQYTLEITLDGRYSQEQVMRHFAWIATAPVYEPLYEQYMNADRTASQYGTSFETTMCSGAFKFTSWVVGAELVFEKNPYYPLADRIHMDGLVYTIVENAGTRIQMFENGELHYTGVPTGEIAAYMDDPRAKPTKTRSVPMIELNASHPDLPLHNLNMRKALYHAVDRATIAELGSGVPAPYLVSNSVVAYADGTSFRSIADAKGYLPPNNGYDPELALEYFNRAMDEEGLSKLELTINYNSASDIFTLICEYLQEAWPTIFGADRINLTLNGGPSAQILDTTKSVITNPRAYDLAITGWSRIATDYNPAEALLVWTSDYPRRNGNYQSDRIDALYAESRTEEVRLDEQRLTEIAIEGEQVFLEEVLAIPTVQSIGMVLVNENLITGIEEYEIEVGYALRWGDFRR